jgi:hypothetical protein
MIHIKISVSKGFKNDKLSSLLQKEDISINEAILSYGSDMYLQQGNILKNITINNETEILKNEIKELNKKYQESLINLQKEKDLELEQFKKQKENEIETIKTHKYNYENNLKLNFEKKELEFNETINKLNNEKDKILKNYLEDKNNMEKSFRDIYSNKETEYNSIINKIEHDKLSIRDQCFKDVQDIESKLKEQYENKIKSLEMDMNKMQNEKKMELNSLITISKDIVKSEYDRYIKLQEDQIKDLNTKLNDLNEFNRSLHLKNEQLTERIFEVNKTMENSKFDSIIGNFNVLNEKLSDNFDKFYKGSFEKGLMGEQFIENYLCDAFTNCKIINTSSETSAGDLLFIFDKVRTLVESKNINYMKQFDIDKFYKDIEIRVNRNEINSAILISLHNTNLVHGKRLFHFEIKWGIPIIMIGDVFKNKEYIRFSISVFNYLIKNGFASSETDEEKFSFIVNTINEVYMLFKYQMTFLNNDKAMLIKMEDSYRKREMNLNDIEKLFKVIFSKCPEISIHDNKSKNGMDDIINKIKSHITTIQSDSDFKINIKNLEIIGISRNDIRTVGGIKNVQDALNEIKDD